MSGFRRNPQYEAMLRETVMQRVTRGTEIIRDTARGRLDRSGGGELYPGRPRRASLPHESPVSQSGELFESLQTYKPRDRGDRIEGAAGTDLYKIIFIEKGTARMAPRPLLRPALMESKPAVMKVMGGQHA